LVFGNEVSLRHLIFFIFNYIIYTLLWCNFFSFLWNLHSYDVNWDFMVLHYDRTSFWAIFILRCENQYFWIRKDYFCVLLDCIFTHVKCTFNYSTFYKFFFLMMFIMSSGWRPKIIVLRLNSDHDLLMFQLNKFAMICWIFEWL